MSTPAPALGGPRAFCRDCLGDLDIKARRCGICGSPRVVRHHALPSLTLAHIDCDAFYATVEKRDNPELADKPVKAVHAPCCSRGRGFQSSGSVNCATPSTV